MLNEPAGKDNCAPAVHPTLPPHPWGPRRRARRMAPWPRPRPRSPVSGRSTWTYRSLVESNW